MEKHPFAKITFKNCNLEYGYTICEWCEVSNQLEAVDSNFQGVDETTYDGMKKPEVVITLVFLTEVEFAEEIKNWDI